MCIYIYKYTHVTKASRRREQSIGIKRSESRGYGGGRPIWATLGRWSPELGSGMLKKGLGTASVLWSLKEKNWGKPDPQDFFLIGGQVGFFFYMGGQDGVF